MKKNHKSDCGLTEEILTSLEGFCLFYPCSGGDFKEPLRIFSPHVSDFIFCDKGYFTPRDQDTRHQKLDIAADKAPPLLAAYPDYVFMSRLIKGPPTNRPMNWISPPCQLTEIYLHIKSGKIVRIHRIRDQGLVALHFIKEPIGVFYYGQDSHGEGGSGDLWLSAPLFEPLLCLMKPGGLVVTTGCNTSTRKDHFSDLAHPGWGAELHSSLGHRLRLLETSREVGNIWQVDDLWPSREETDYLRSEAKDKALHEFSRVDVWGRVRPRWEGQRDPIVLGHPAPTFNELHLAAQGGDAQSQLLVALLCLHSSDQN